MLWSWNNRKLHKGQTWLGMGGISLQKKLLNKPSNLTLCKQPIFTMISLLLLFNSRGQWLHSAATPHRIIWIRNMNKTNWKNVRNQCKILITLKFTVTVLAHDHLNIYSDTCVLLLQESLGYTPEVNSLHLHLPFPPTPFFSASAFSLSLLVSMCDKKLRLSFRRLAAASVVTNAAPQFILHHFKATTIQLLRN